MPEMSYSPAYRQAQDRSASPTMARPPLQSMDYPEPSHQRPPRPSSERRHHDSSPRSSGPRPSRTYSPPTSTYPMEEETPVTQVVLANGSSYKERPSRSSWADQPSLISAEHSGTTRARKRGASDDREPDGGQNALLLLVCDPLILILRNVGLSVLTPPVVPTLGPRSRLLVGRNDLYIIRITIRHPQHSTPPMLIPLQHIFLDSDLRPPLTSSSHP